MLAILLNHIFFKYNRDIMLVLQSEDGRIIRANDAAVWTYGYSREELLSLKMKDLCVDSDIPLVGEKPGGIFETRHRCKDGSILQVEVSSQYESLSEKTVILSVVRDISQRKKVEAALIASEERFRRLAENAPDIIYRLKLLPEPHFEYLSPATAKIMGCRPEVLYRNFDILTLLSHPEDPQDLAEIFAGDGQTVDTARLVRPDGRIIWLEFRRVQLPDQEGRPLAVEGIVRDITERKKLEDELRRAKIQAEKDRERAECLAATDPLTGLLNRRAFMDRLEDEYNRTQRQGDSLSIILGDIDRFKRVNDTYGHSAGDFILHQFALCLTKTCRLYDILGRYGGEEFIVCLPETAPKEALTIAERMRQAVENQSFDLPGSSASNRITASFGVSFLDKEPEKTISELINEADEALYRAKSEGRNRVASAAGN